jgi:diaminopimelate epimerase
VQLCSFLNRTGHSQPESALFVKYTKEKETMKFTKMQGLGNDYVYVNGFEEQIENPQELARKISDRHYGVGSDGLILIQPSKVADFEMVMYNADGSRGEMCGNGMRCVGKYVYDYGLTQKQQISVDTLAGIKYLELFVEDGKVAKVCVDMGEPILTPAQIPVVTTEDSSVRLPIEVDGTSYEMTCVSMGNPHAVLFLDEIACLNLENIGPKFEHHVCFPNRVNTEFVRVVNPEYLEMRVWERGSGETLACGTGACAVLVAAVLNGLANHEATVRLLGGELQIRWDRENNHIYMTGAATTIFEGEIFW